MAKAKFGAETSRTFTVVVSRAHIFVHHIIVPFKSTEIQIEKLQLTISSLHMSSLLTIELILRTRNGLGSTGYKQKAN